MSRPGRIFLLPTYLAQSNDVSFLSPQVLSIIRNTSLYLVENIRSARRFISSLALDIDISTLQFFLLDKRASENTLLQAFDLIASGSNCGILSEAGLPGLADPGTLAVSLAHKRQFPIVPVPGASAIQTALIVSGFQGQQFTFHGYLPVPKTERIRTIRSIYQEFERTGYTQLFMETPYRNDQLMKALINTLPDHYYLHVSSDLFGDDQIIITQPISKWKRTHMSFHKRPAVFSIGHLA